MNHEVNFKKNPAPSPGSEGLKAVPSKEEKDEGGYRSHSFQEISYKHYCFTWFKLSVALKVTFLSTWTWDKASEAGDHSYLCL